MSAVKFLRQIRFPLVAAVTSSTRRVSGLGRLNHLYAATRPRGVNSQLHKYFDLRRISLSAKRLCSSGHKLRYGTMVAFAVLGVKTITWQRAYCQDDRYVSSYPRKRSLTATSATEENLLRAFLLIRKMLVPVLLVLNVWLNWGQSHPVFLIVKVALIFLTTKPFPTSVHVFVEQLRHQIRSRHPLSYTLHPSQVKLVEVEDYMFLCLARVLLRDEKLILIGILGSWWILPLSSWRELFLVDTTSWRNLFSTIKSRIRLDVAASCR